MNENTHTCDLLIVGAGIAGITAAVEAAETGMNVILVEKNPYIGGKIVQFNQYFPKLCPPACGMEINTRRLRNNNLIKLFTLAEVINLSGEAGNYKANIKLKQRYVNNRCTVCGDCVQVCPEKRKNDFNYSMNETTSIYIPFENAYPQKYVIDMNSCKGSSCNKCVEVCKYNAIDLNEEETSITVETKSVIWATGWKPYDANKLDILGFGKYPDVITNVMMERIASCDGPTNGKILKPSNKKEIGSVAFVQCAGSRDENHLEYCSSVCCMATLKQTRYIREQNPDAEIHIYYIDLRSNGLLEDFLAEVEKDEKVFFHRGKVAKVFRDDGSDKLVVEAEDSLTNTLVKRSVDLVVLATGMEPNVEGLAVDKSSMDKNNFIRSNGNGIIACGVCTNPKDVAGSVKEATGSVLRAIQIIRRN